MKGSLCRCEGRVRSHANLASLKLLLLYFISCFVVLLPDNLELACRPKLMCSRHLYTQVARTLVFKTKWWWEMQVWYQIS
jgi:hypothetical protein